MYIPLDMKNTPKTKNKKLSEDRKEMIRILLAFVVMGIIFWFMLISSSVPESREPRPAAREAACNNSRGHYI
jgi:hypothetical protein